MNRPFILGLSGAVIVGAAIGLTYFVDSESGKETTAAVKLPKNGAAKSATDQPPSSDGPPQNKAAIDRNKESESTGPVVSQVPTFDVVRVNPRGDAVIAGRASPNASVVVRDGRKEVGRAKADARGEWVVIPKQPLPEGSRELTLSAKSRDGTTTQSDRNVVISVPGRTPPDGAGNKSKQVLGSLAVLVPRKGDGASIVMQKPSEVRPVSLGANDKDDKRQRTVRVPSGEDAPVSIEAVDYDEAGNVTISGSAATKVPLSVYIDNQHAASGASDRQGRWRVVPGGALTPGIHTLRVDQLGTDGKVVGRAETRFTRAKQETSVPNDAVVHVEPGNSLWRIARRVYGAGIQYSVIFEANREQIRDPDLIYPGQVFFVPHVN